MDDVAAAITALADLPLPGQGATPQRLRRLAELGRADLSLTKIVEAHVDAVAICAELGTTGPGPAEIWGVWAAEPPTVPLLATSDLDDRWQLNGAKPWCSGATTCTHALVTATSPDGSQLFAVALDDPGVTSGPAEWAGAGMARAGTRTLQFTAVPARPVGGPGAYINRPGFWHGAIGIAAVWWGGAQAVADTLYRKAASLDAHGLAALGSVDAALAAVEALLMAVAADIDRDPASDRQADALRCRAIAEWAATSVLAEVGRALGPGPYATDPSYAQHVDDLPVYLRQSHGTRDLAVLGRLAAGR